MFDIDGIEMLDFQPPVAHEPDSHSESLKPPFSLQPAGNGWTVVNRRGDGIVLCIDYNVARFTANVFNLADLYGAKTLRRYGRGE